MSLTSRLTSASNIKESSVTCRLDDLPPVTEMEHQLGRCYC